MGGALSNLSWYLHLHIGQLIIYTLIMNVEFLQKYCKSLPAATEDIKWGQDLCFSVGGKMFCVTSFEGPFSASFKVPDNDFEELASQEGFAPAPYMARAKWVLVTDQSRLKKKEWEHFIRQSYDLVKEKLTGKAKKELGLK
jgi:predicted DNA-binding protein (MmcQ/YjbR family)